MESTPYTEPRRAAPAPLSPVQERVWFLHRMDPGATVFQLTVALRIAGPLDAARLAWAFEEVTRRHPVLRSTFTLLGEAPVQVELEPGAPPLWRQVDLRHLAAGRRRTEEDRLVREEWEEPFDLAAEPGCRGTLILLGAEEALLLVSVHRIAADRASLRLLLEALWQLYDLSPASPSSCLELKARQRRWLESAAGAAELSWWRQRLAGAPDTLEFPFDRSRPPVQRWRGGRQILSPPPELEWALAAAFPGEGSPVLLAGFLALLKRYTGQDDLVIGLPASYRRERQDQGVIGPLTNTLAVRVDLAGDPTFRELLARVGESVRQAREHGDLPFEVLLQELRPQRDLSRPPLVQAAFETAAPEIPARGPRGLSVRPLPPRGGRTELDLSLRLPEAGSLAGGALDYDRDLLDDATALRLLEHYERLLAAAAADPDRRLSELALASDAERHQLRVEWNDTRGETTALLPLHALFERQAARTPDAVALATADASLTYAGLDARADLLARRLRSRGVGPEMPVGVFLERTPEMVVALLGILKAGGVYLPLDPAYPQERVAYMLADSRAVGVVTARPLLDRVPGHDGWTLCQEDAEEDAGEPAAGAPVATANLAYLIYTSGSTGRPKGVAIRHSSAAVLVAWAADNLAPEELAGVLASTSICFDLSVFELFVPLSLGGRVVLARNALALPALRDLGVTLVNTVPSAAAELVRSGGFPPSVTTVALAGEALPRTLVDDLYRLPHVRRVLNLYGPSEDTTYSTFTPVERDDPRPPTIGRPLRDTRSYVVDGGLRPVPLGVLGELVLGGEGLARGYLGRPELTAERFTPDPFSGEPGARLYRTGDLVRHLPDGDLAFLGRLDHQVKVRGFRIELGEVEAALALQPGVRESVVVAREDVPGDKRLVAYVVAGEPAAGETPTASALRAALRETLPEPMLPSTFVFLDALPRTLNGKVDRRALPAPAAERADGAGVSPRTPEEEVLAGLWSAVLGVGGIGAEDDFFALGGHSLLGARVLMGARDAFGVELPLSAVFAHPTLAGLAAAVVAARRQSQGLTAPPLRPVPRDQRLPLSFAQQRLWFLEAAHPGLAAYAIPAAFALTGELDKAALAAALGEIVRRHEALRTRLVEDAEGPRQVIDASASLPLSLVDLTGEPGSEAELRRLARAESDRPFDLARGPLLRAVLVRLAAARHVLLLTVHHVAADGWSLDFLQRELAALYDAGVAGRPSPLAELPVQYADFAVWQREWLRGEVLDAQLDYWRQRLTGAPAILELPADRPRPAVRSFRGGTLALPLPDRLREALLTLGQGRGATLFMALLAGFKALLQRYAGQDDLVVGSVIANRTRSEVEALIGFFANTLALRTDLAGEPDFVAVLARVRETALGAYAHQDLPFERLVEAIHPERDLSRNPVFQVMFQLLGAPPAPSPEAPLRIERIEREHGTAKFDLYLYLTERRDGGLDARLEYAGDLFDAATATRLLSHYAALLAAAAAEPRRPVAELSLLSAVERHQLLQEWNDTAGPAGGRLLHERVADQARRTPDAVALAGGDEALTYRELDERANRLAHHLQSLGVGPEQRVGIFLSRSPQIVVAILAVLRAGGAYVPIDPAYPADRVAFTLADAAVRGVLTEERLLPSLPEPHGWAVALERDREAIAARSAAPPRAGVGPESLAYLIYTSGSTGRPKGVAIRHGSAAVLLDWAERTFSAEELEGTLASTSICFDISVFEIFAPLARGGRVLVARDALDLAAVASRQRVTLINTVPSAMAELLRMGAVPDSVRTVNLAGEALQGSLVAAVFRQTAAERAINLYGPSEDTTYSTFAVLKPGFRREPAVGRPVTGARAYLLDPRMRLLPPGVPGELYLGGEGISRGYLNRPELTAERYLPDPFAEEPGRRLYRTGDLIRTLPNGELHFLNRLDHQVKVRGFRIELGEIEAALRRCSGVEAAVVAVREDLPGDRRLVAYVVPGAGGATATALRNRLRETLPEPMVPSAFVLLDALPLNPNGKVDRKALPAPEAGRAARTDAALVRPRRPLEEIVAGIWSELLGVEEIGVDDDFFGLGGHSLLATRLVSRLRERLGVELSLREIFAHSRLAALAERIEAEVPATAGPRLPPILPATVAEEPVLSYGQQRLLLVDRIYPGNPAYNLPTGFRLSGPLSVPALERGLEEVVRRHQVLRTVFPGGPGGGQALRPEVSPAGPFPLPQADLRALPAAARRAELERLSWQEGRRVFDLARGPLLRALLVRLAEGEHALFLDLHHIAGDDWSLGIVARELAALYGAFLEGCPSPLPEPPLQYADFARWQRRWLASEGLAAETAFWRELLRGAPPVLELPADRPRPAAQSLRGGAAKIVLPRDLEAGLVRLGRSEGATLFMTLLAGFFALLQRYTGADDLVTGLPIANRERGETEEIVGFFANMLVLRADLSGGPDAHRLLARTREAALAAYAHQSMPFERLVEELKPERDPSRNPIFQVSFQLLNTGNAVPDLPGLRVTPLERDHGTAKLDLELTMAPTPEGLACFAEYSADLFAAATIDRLLAHYRRLLAALVAEPERRISELPLLSPAELRQALVEWNDTGRDYGPETTLHGLVAAQAARTPERTAVVFEGAALSYGELDARANQLARFLRERGVGPEVLVGLCVERSLEMVVGLLGVLKAGGAYVPLDPAYPEDRLAFMLADSRTPVLLTQERLQERLARLLPEGGPVLIPLDAGWPEIATFPTAAPEELALPANPAYAIYTSGSTGRPKGAVNTHRGIVNRLLWMQETYGLGEDDRVLQKTPFSFDVSVWEFFWPLLTGARLVVARPGGHQESGYLADLIASEGITTVHFVPSMLQLFLTEPGLERCVPLRRVIASGEALPYELKERFFIRLGCAGAELHNLYGPTEAAVDVTAWACAPGGEGVVPIGRPVANTRVHVLDRDFAPVPLGVAGELYLGGVQLARGYLERPALTAERFVPDPFAGPGERLYRTGDLVRRLAGGTLVYLGRLDHQVKLRGFRIELGEIEDALARHPEVRETVVMLREVGAGDRRLVAYVVPAGPAVPEASVLRDQLREHLRALLPDHMVPSTFVILDALPLTPNGKVDRKALPAPERERSSLADFVAPRTATEETLAKIWAGVLGLDRASVTDNFFDLGGHSLLALHVMTHIRTHFGLDLPLGAMFRNATVEKMARLIDGETTASTSPLVLLGGWSSTRTPFFCVHGVGGNVFRFVQLARTSSRPFYGVQGWADLQDTEYLGSVAGMAERYMAEIRKLQPHGPYFLGGVCLGCMVSFEMARRFEAEGETVAFLGLFDTSSSNLPPEVLDTFSFEAGIANELSIALDPAAMRELPREEHLAYVLAEGRKQGLLPPAFTEADARRYIAIYRLNLGAFLKYNPPPSEVGATLFGTAWDDSVSDPTFGWGALAHRGVEVIPIPGDNASMLRPPHVEVFGERLRLAMDEAEARTLSALQAEARREGEEE